MHLSLIVLKRDCHCFCLLPTLKVFRVLMDGVLPMAAKIVDIGSDPKLQKSFIQVNMRFKCVKFT